MPIVCPMQNYNQKSQMGFLRTPNILLKSFICLLKNTSLQNKVSCTGIEIVIFLWWNLIRLNSTQESLWSRQSPSQTPLLRQRSPSQSTSLGDLEGSEFGPCLPLSSWNTHAWRIAGWRGLWVRFSLQDWSLEQVGQCALELSCFAYTVWCRNVPKRRGHWSQSSELVEPQDLQVWYSDSDFSDEEAVSDSETDDSKGILV